MPAASPGNYVGETLFTIRAHQGDLRLDWNASANDKLFAPLLVRHLRGRSATRTRSRSCSRRRNDQPFWNVGVQLEPRVRAVGDQRGAGRLQPHHASTAETFDWAGVGAGNAKYGIAGGQPIDGLSSDRLGQRPHGCPGAIATDSDTLAKTYQINEKLTWLKGRHAFKFGGQFLRYDQQRFYAGNNGLLGFITYNGAFTGFAFSDFLLDQVSGKGRGGGDPNDPWTHLQNRIGALRPGRLQGHAEPDAEPGPALGLHLAARGEGQPAVELRPGATGGSRSSRRTASLEDRALYKPYYKGFEPRVGFAWSASDRLVFRGGYGISQFMEGTGANLRLPLNPPFFFESAVDLRPDDRRGHDRHRLRRARAGHDARPATCAPTTRTCARSSPSSGTRSSSTALTDGMSAQVGYVGHHATTW